MKEQRLRPMRVLNTISLITNEADMNNVKVKKLQSLLITHLLEEGKVELCLPDGFVLEIGIIQENKRGDLVKADNYCYVLASKENNSTIIDSYNLGLTFEQDEDKLLYNDEFQDSEGRVIRRFNVV